MSEQRTDIEQGPGVAEEAAHEPAALIPAGRARTCIALLVLLGFSLGCSEFAVIGIESDLARDFGVSLQTVGQLISMYSLTYAVLTPALALSTGRFRRYQLLVAYSVVFCAGNVMAAFATGFATLLVSRVMLGSVSGALLAVGVTYIPELTEPSRSPIVISVVYAAFSVAMVVITSLGKIVADTLDWHLVMDGALVLAIVTCALAVALMPRAGATDSPASVREQVGLLGEPAVVCGMLIFLFGIGSVYTFYGYVTPYLEQVLGMGTAAASATLVGYGVVCFLSNLLGGWVDARFGIRALVVVFALQAAVLLGIWLAGSNVTVAIALILALGLLMYLASVPCVSMFMGTATRLHPKALTLASSLEPLSFNVGISFGTAVGGFVVAGPGIAQAGVVGAALALVASGISALAARFASR